MSEDAKYLIDSNIFIEAHRHYYAFNLCPGFWKSLVWLHGKDRLISLDRVKDEIGHETDELVNWIDTDMPDSGFAVSEDDAVISKFGQIQTWAQGQSQFTAAAREEFATVADAWLVAYALTHGLVLVTHEAYKPDVKKRIPIPNVCRAFDVQCVNTFEMLKSLTITYEWSAPA